MKFLEHFQGFISDNLKVATTFLSLVKLETRLAGLTIVPLIINICVLIAISLTTWLTFIVLAALLINLVLGNVILSVSLILGLNSIALGILFKTLSSNLRKMSFEKTRASLRSKQGDYHGPKIEADERH